MPHSSSLSNIYALSSALARASVDAPLQTSQRMKQSRVEQRSELNEAIRLSSRLPKLTRKMGPSSRSPSDFPLAFDVACEVVEDCLPSTTLLLNRVSGVGVEGHLNADTGRTRSKHDLRQAVAERILD